MCLIYQINSFPASSLIALAIELNAKRSLYVQPLLFARIHSTQLFSFTSSASRILQQGRIAKIFVCGGMAVPTLPFLFLYLFLTSTLPLFLFLNCQEVWGVLSCIDIIAIGHWLVGARAPLDFQLLNFTSLKSR